MKPKYKKGEVYVFNGEFALVIEIQEVVKSGKIVYKYTIAYTDKDETDIIYE